MRWSERAQLKAGETLLVLGAGGATGYAAVQLGKHLGARVIASAPRPSKRALALAGGADLAIDARAEDWRDQVKAANGGKGVDVVFDPVGGEATEPAFRSLGWNGRHLVVGFPGGIAALRTNLPLLKGASLIGVDIRQFGINEPDAASANVRAVYDLAGSGVIRPSIAQYFPARRVRRSHGCRGRRARGGTDRIDDGVGATPGRYGSVGPDLMLVARAARRSILRATRSMAG